MYTSQLLPHDFYLRKAGYQVAYNLLQTNLGFLSLVKRDYTQVVGIMSETVIKSLNSAGIPR
jgi:hypothetical protein